MSKHDPSITPASRRHDGWSLAKQAAFLRQLSATHSVSAAAKSVGMSRQSAYRLRSKLKGQAFDLAWEVAFHHSYDVLAHAALDRALNGVEVPVFFQGEQVGSYRKYDERLTVALLGKMTLGGNPALGRLAPQAECHARDFEGLLAQLEAGDAVCTGAPGPDDPGELAALRQFGSGRALRDALDHDGEDDWAEDEDEGESGAPIHCPSALGDEELIEILQQGSARREK
ncbi:hypothetical protein [Qipengyuania psychrotolerans]|uniref:Helix-turn-helix domain-containing protein n=1 Tax=Qipengyuania psychrotolerans TaxID=2867238 RepID=A0ABX8ZHY2_9SPHN|nr:hypothetical protein [Qipengyuania psychrotolerans]QZD87343.1 hypothetical protein K3166_01115 [Qipengyuania psychrotolerans]